MGIDLVLERIFYDSETGILKTTDFGFEATDGFEDCDTLPYIPPERLQSPTQQNKYSKVQTSSFVKTRLPFAGKRRLETGCYSVQYVVPLLSILSPLHGIQN